MILLDMCVPRKFLRLLHEWGYDASSVDEHLSANASDTSVIATAQALDAVLLTVDMDFSNILDYPPSDYSGIVIMRYVV